MKYRVAIYDLDYEIEAKSREGAIRAAIARYTKMETAQWYRHCSPDRLTRGPTIAEGRKWEAVLEKTGTFREDWEDFMTLFKGPVKYDISDLHIEADGTLGYSHSIQRVRGTDTKGQPVDLTWRDTAAYRKIGGKWLIMHEHGSVPVDLATGKPDLTSKP